jgi:hypothetical protein
MILKLRAMKTVPQRISGRHDKRSVNVVPGRFRLAIRSLLADHTG